MHKRLLPLLVCLLVLVGCNFPVKVDLRKADVTATPALSPTPTLPPPPTQTPTLPPTPTPQPTVRIEMAEQELFLGDYEQARREFQDARESAVEPEVQAVAAIGMGRALFFQQNYSSAIDLLNNAITAFPDSTSLPVAYFFLGGSYDAQKIYDQAAAAYEKFLELRPGVLDDFVQELRGDAYLAAGIPTKAAEAYAAAVDASQDSDTTWTALKLGQAYSQAGDFTKALQTYLDVYERTDNDYAKAQANLLMGQTYLTLGQPEQAYARFTDSVSHYPMAFDSYTGLVELVNAGLEVNELDRGIVDFYAGQYGLAIDAFNRYESNVSDANGTMYYYRALSYRALYQFEDALADFDTLITQFPSDRYWAKAWEEKADTLWAYEDKYQEAADTLIEFVKQAPDAPEAPGFLFDAARIQERNNQLSEAAATWEQLINTYPSSERSYRGLFLAGISSYRVKDYSKALLTFQRALVLTGNNSDQAAAYLWIGKTQQAQGNVEASQSAWQQAAQRDPTGYYSVRANELLKGEAPFSLERPVDLGYDLGQERAEADDWMKTTFALPAETNLDGLGELEANPHTQRGKALWELGAYGLARNEFEIVRQSLLSDPVGTYRLMNTMYEMGIYRSAILASRHVLDLANLDDISTLKAPAYFNHIRFGVYYKDLILQVSKSEKLDPLFILSVIRQESLFEGFATSSAGARGLMQIMPLTGQEIASNMSWPAGFTLDDLYRPIISIPLGTRYMARQRDYFDGSLSSALAAYNGGPGNTIQWSEMANGDPDLLLEVIRADETRSYIMQIYTFYNLYRIIYERGY